MLQARVGAPVVPGLWKGFVSVAEIGSTGLGGERWACGGKQITSNSRQQRGSDLEP